MLDRVFILVGIPASLRALTSEQNVSRLLEAHPRARVVITDEPERFAALLPEADGVLAWPGFVPDAAALRPGGRLRWVHFLSAGVNGVLTPELVAAEHVAITSTKGPMAPPMAEHAAMLVLALARDLPGFLQDQVECRWRFLKDVRPTLEMFGRTILVLGVGEVGGELARISQAGFRMRVLGFSRSRRDNPYVDRYVERADLHAALAEADVVALCLALTPATERIIDAAALAAMKPTAILVNVARGGLIDEDALIAALRQGRLGGAGLDATTVEPLPPEDRKSVV